MPGAPVKREDATYRPAAKEVARFLKISMALGVSICICVHTLTRLRAEALRS